MSGFLFLTLAFFNFLELGECLLEYKSSVTDYCLEDNYFTLSEDNRNSSFFNPYYKYCDQSGFGYTSPDWKGPNWYRFVQPAGFKIPESPVKSYYCGTNASGWLNGKHPENFGDVIEQKACFHFYDNECWYSIDIQIMNCGDFYVYYLPQTPYCYMRYCAE